MTELADRVVGNDDAVEELQLDLTAQQHRVPAWNESLLMSMSDALLRSLQRWITDHWYPMRTLCYISLQAVERLPLPITRCLGVLTNIPVFTFFPWTVSLTKTLFDFSFDGELNWKKVETYCQRLEFLPFLQARLQKK